MCRYVSCDYLRTPCAYAIMTFAVIRTYLDRLTHKITHLWRGTQEAEGTGFEYQQAGNTRAGVQIPLSPP